MKLRNMRVVSWLNGLITIQGEDYACDSSIHTIAEYDTRIEPYEVDTVPYNRFSLL